MPVTRHGYGRVLKPYLTTLRFLTLSSNWDSYGARRISICSVLGALIGIYFFRNKNPQVVPCSDGGIQIEWHNPGDSAEFYIDPMGNISFVDLMEGGTGW